MQEQSLGFVLILVLMEEGLGRKEIFVPTLDVVLILVLMEDGLGLKRSLLLKK